MEISDFIYLFVNWWTFGLFPLFGYYKLYCYQIYVHMFFFLEYISRRGIVGAHGNSMFNLLRNFQTFPKWFYHLPFLPNTWFPVSYILTNTCFYLSFLLWPSYEVWNNMALCYNCLLFTYHLVKKYPQVITNDHTNCAQQVTHVCWSRQLSTDWQLIEIIKEDISKRRKTKRTRKDKIIMFHLLDIPYFIYPFIGYWAFGWGKKRIIERGRYTSIRKELILISKDIKLP